MFDTTKAKDLYVMGYFDYQIAEQLGTSKSSVQRWRTRLHLPANGVPMNPRIKKSYDYTLDYPKEIQEMVDKTKVCLNCGKVLKYLESARNNRGYCSYHCFQCKPPKMAYVEKTFGFPVRDIILKMLNDGVASEIVAGRLGIGKPQLFQWIRKLNIKKKVVWG